MEIGELPGKEHPKTQKSIHPKTQKSIQKPKRASKTPNYTVFVILNSKAKRSCISKDFVLIFLFVS